MNDLSKLFTNRVYNEILAIGSVNNCEQHRKRQQGNLEELSMRELETQIEIYFANCTTGNIIPTPAGLCNYIGITHRLLLQLLKEDSERAEILLQAMEVIHAVYQEAVVSGDMPVKTYTFMAKNYWNMSDKEIIEVKTEDNDVRLVEIDGRLNTLRQLTS